MFDVGTGVVDYLVLEVMLVVVVSGAGTDVAGVAGVDGVVGTGSIPSVHGYLFGPHYHYTAVCPTPGRSQVSPYIDCHCSPCTLGLGSFLCYPLCL